MEAIRGRRRTTSRAVQAALPAGRPGSPWPRAALPTLRVSARRSGRTLGPGGWAVRLWRAWRGCAPRGRQGSPGGPWPPLDENRP